MSRVLILFQANTEAFEQLALAVAVGAVEAEGTIRLRRLATPDAPEVGHKSYGRLHPVDLPWADVIVVGLEAATPNEGELGILFELLGVPDLSEKSGWTFGPSGPGRPSTEAQRRVAAALKAAKVAMMPVDNAAGSEDLMAFMKECGRISGAK